MSVSIPAGTYVIDPSHTEVGFVARHAMVTKVRGYFRAVEGQIVVADEFANSSATATMKVDSVDTGNGDRDGHLKSADFFDAENTPEITFVSTGIKDVKGDEFTLVGDLTIKGITKPVVLDVTLNKTGQHPMMKVPAVGFDATATLKRSDFGLGYAVPAVSDEVSLRITVEAHAGAHKH